MDCSPPGSSVHGTDQVRIPKCVAIPFSRGSSQPRDQTQVSCTAGRFFTIWAIREPLWLPLSKRAAKEITSYPVSNVRDCLGTWSTQLSDTCSSMRERVGRGQIPTDIKYDSKVSWTASNKDLLLLILLDLMDHVSGTNKKDVLVNWGWEFFLPKNHKRRGLVPLHLPLGLFAPAGKAPPERPKQLKRSLLSQEGRSACESRRHGEALRPAKCWRQG